MIGLLKTRFESNRIRHAELSWESVAARLEARPAGYAVRGRGVSPAVFRAQSFNRC